MRTRLVSLILVGCTIMPACKAEPRQQLATSTAADAENAMETQSRGEHRRGPASRFVTLDDYLAFLEKGAAIDKAYYRKVGPDRYVLVTTVQPPAPPQYFTRQELARKFGFSE